MTHKERVLHSLSHAEPDRVPWDYWAAPEVTERLMGELSLPDKESLLRFLEVDFRYALGPSKEWQEVPGGRGTLKRDGWGVVREKVAVESGGGRWAYDHVRTSPLEKMVAVSEIENYPYWPSPDDLDYGSVAAQCDAARGHAVVFGGDRLDRTAQLKPMMYLRGMEQTYIDLKENPKVVECILEHIGTYYLEYDRRVFESAGGKIDIFLMGDDFGMQEGLLLSADDWRRYFRAGFRKYIELAHEFGVKVMHHTCGAVRELIPEFIDAGLDILQSLQPRARGMDLGGLKREFGGYLCFHGGIDIQEVLPRGTAEEVREHARRQLEAGKPGGGYAACTAHNLQPDVPTRNVIALFEAYRDFGRY